MNEDGQFAYHEDPAHPGWMRWALRDESRFNAFLGDLRLRREGAAVTRVRMDPARAHSNLGDAIHGGAQLGFMDVALFAAARSFGLDGAAQSVTLDLSSHFIAAGRIDRPLDAVVELLRETGRMMFLRGLLMQDEVTVASFSGTIRKFSATG